MRNYYFKNDICVITTNETRLVIKLTNDSGRIVYRNKIDTILGIIHPSIELGIDEFGTRWFIHHHYKNTYPSIDSEEVFSQGVKLFYDDRIIFYDKFEIIKRSLIAWNDAKSYNWLTQNCQHFVNEIAFNKSSSEAIGKISNMALFFSLLTGITAKIFRDKLLTRIAIGLAIVGIVVKFINNYSGQSDFKFNNQFG